MILQVVKYGHPALRKKGERIETITAAIRKLVADMFETMYANKGVGLAAQQVGQPLQLTVIDVRAVADRPSSLEVKGEPTHVDDFMPLVLINPQLTVVGEPLPGGEGCLSFPEIYAEISRPASINVRALNQEGKIIEFHCGGLLSRVIQHEVDHLNGILFIDRMNKETKADLAPLLEELRTTTKRELQAKPPKGVSSK